MPHEMTEKNKRRPKTPRATQVVCSRIFPRSTAKAAIRKKEMFAPQYENLLVSSTVAHARSRSNESRCACRERHHPLYPVFKEASRLLLAVCGDKNARQSWAPHLVSFEEEVHERHSDAFSLG